MLVLVVVACGSTAPRPSAPPAPASVAACTAHRVHGVLRDAEGEPLAGVQVSLTGGEGHDDAKTDDAGRFDLHSSTSGRDRLVIFYVDNNVSRQLSTTRCDEELNLRIGLHVDSPAVM